MITEDRDERKNVFFDNRVNPALPWSKVNIHYLHKIKKLCQKHNIRLVYFHMPLNKSAKFPEQKWFDDYYQILDSLEIEQIPRKIHFLEKRLFRDKLGHLNENGRSFFHEKYLAPLLKKAGIKLIDTR